MQTQTGDYPAATASLQRALDIFHDLGYRLGQARAQHTRALAITRDIGVPLEEARALEGIGNSHLHDGNPAQAAPYLRQALAIYQRIGAPAAKRVQETLQRHGLTPSTPEPRQEAPSSEGHRRRGPSTLARSP